MIQPLKQLFLRYVSQHYQLRRLGFPLTDSEGETIGFIDHITISKGHLVVEGWAESAEIILTVEGQSLVASPYILREDVAQLRNTDPKTPYGFFIEQKFTFAQYFLSLKTQSGQICTHMLPAFEQTEFHRARRKLIWPFLRDCFRILPAGLRYLWHRDAASRLAAKTGLGLQTVPKSTPLNQVQLQLPTETPPGLLQCPVTIILPVYNAFDLLPEVLNRVLHHTDLPWHLVVIEDCSLDKKVRPFLRDWVAKQDIEKITLIENKINRGFISSVNSGFQIAAQRKEHAILLNSDAFVPDRWASRLIAPILAEANVATVTPMSNDAEIFTTPVLCQRTSLKPGDGDAIDARAQTLNWMAALPETPTGVGFCMAMNREYLNQVPEFDLAFGRGYGEEVDWCQKARALGGRHLGQIGLFVEHRGGVSFGSAAKQHLIAEGNEMIVRRYPGYDREVQEFIRADPLSTARLALAITALDRRATAPVPVYLAHSMGGGAEIYLQGRVADDIQQIGGAIILRVGDRVRWQIEVHVAEGRSDAMSDDFDMVQAVLSGLSAPHVIYSCGVGDRDPVTLPGHLLGIAQKDTAKVSVLFNDFFVLSPSYNLLGSDRCFRGVPDADNRDSAHQIRRPDGTVVSLTDWRDAWAPMMARADEITVFSDNSRDLVAQAYPRDTARIVVRRHRLPHQVPKLPTPGKGRVVIGILGNIGYEKGAAVLQKLSTHLAKDGTADLVVIGNVTPTCPLDPSATIHGGYDLRDLPDIAAHYEVSCWLMPSIWPETFSYVTHEVLATGLPVYCFDLGAQAEAVTGAIKAGAPGGIITLHDGKPDFDVLHDYLLAV